MSLLWEYSDAFVKWGKKKYDIMHCNEFQETASVHAMIILK